MMHDDVRAYYQAFGDREWTRLATAEGSVEFAVNTHAIACYLPPGARVLDIGGGPARYSLWLAERGHRVVLADLAPKLLAIARDKVAASAAGALVEEIVEADACDLGRWPDGSFDAALALGPFYHLPAPAERDRAAAELTRVLRAGGLAFVALMPRHAFLRRTLSLPDERHRLAQPDFVARVLDDGVFVNDLPGRFTGGYGVRPEEVAPFFARHGLTMLALLACEGIAAAHYSRRGGPQRHCRGRADRACLHPQQGRHLGGTRGTRHLEVGAGVDTAAPVVPSATKDAPPSRACQRDRH